MTRGSDEYKFQVAVVDWLYGRTRKSNKTYAGNPPMPGLLFTHHYTGHKGGKEGNAERHYLWNLGVRPGISDILNWWKDKDNILRAGMLELKVNAEMSSPQHRIKGVCLDLGIGYELAHNGEEVVAAYRKWGLLPSHTAIRMLDFATPLEKVQRGIDWFRP